MLGRSLPWRTPCVKGSCLAHEALMSRSRPRSEVGRGNTTRLRRAALDHAARGQPMGCAGHGADEYAPCLGAAGASEG